MKNFAERLTALASHWNNVERRIKEYEHFAGGANAAAINELRYAGRRVVDALALIAADIDHAKIAEEFTIAESYVVNADHDVTDGVCFIVMRHVDRVIKKHGREKIADHIPDFWNLYPILLQAQKIVQGSREDRPNRKAEYAKLAAEFLPQLMSMYESLNRISALRVPSEAEEIRRLETRVAIVTGITIIGSIFSILAFFLTGFAWAYPDKYWQILWSIF